MLTLAEISDKTSLPLNPFIGAVLLALTALVACVVLAVVRRPVRWLGFAPSLLVVTDWGLEWFEWYHYDSVLVEYGPWYSVRLLCWVVLLHAPVVYLVAKWPRRWSRPWGIKGHCETCGYDLRGLPSDICPECGTKHSPALTGSGAH